MTEECELKNSCEHYQKNSKTCNTQSYRHNKNMLYCGKLKTTIYKIKKGGDEKK